MISKRVAIFAGIGLLLILVLLAFRLFGEPRGEHIADWDIPWTLECEKCGKQHQQTKLEFASRSRDREDFTYAMRNLGHCPHCDTEWSARLMEPNEAGELELIQDAADAPGGNQNR